MGRSRDFSPLAQAKVSDEFQSVTPIEQPGCKSAGMWFCLISIAAPPARCSPPAGDSKLTATVRIFGRDARCERGISF
jgi:hypothetical protein